MSSSRRFRGSLVVVAALAWSPDSDACLHAAGAAPTDDPISQRGQQAIVLHDGQTEDLVLRVEYDDVDATGLAWIIPVPAAPEGYEAIEGPLFDEVGAWVDLRRQAMSAARARSDGEPDAKTAADAWLQLLPPAKVGPFAIQPIRVRPGSPRGDAGTALNAWMRDHGFAEIAAEGLRYYVDRGWTFLAVKVDPAEGSETVARQGALPPLRITFPSAAAVYPLKLSTHMGVFTARVYLVTADPLPASALAGLRSRGFEAVSDGRYVEAPHFAMGGLEADVAGFTPDDAPPSLRGLLATRFPEASQLHMAVLLSERVNAEDATKWTDDAPGSFRPIDWAEDLAVPPLPSPGPSSKTAQATPEPAPSPDATPSSAAPEVDAKPEPPAAGPKTRKPAPATPPSSGCACTQAPDGGSTGAAWSGLALAAGLRLRTRRRRRRSSRSPSRRGPRAARPAPDRDRSS